MPWNQGFALAVLQREKPVQKHGTKLLPEKEIPVKTDPAALQ